MDTVTVGMAFAAGLVWWEICYNIEKELNDEMANILRR